MDEKLIEKLKEIDQYNHFTTLVPMSKEELKLRKRKNIRHKGLIQLWYVDGLGKEEMLVGGEHAKFDMAQKWPDYMNRNMSIREINERKNEFSR